QAPRTPLARRPTAPPPSTSHAELTRKRISSTAAPMVNSAVTTSVMLEVPSCHTTAAISPTAAAFAPSRNALVHGFARSLGTNGYTTATKKKDGRKMPTVATTALTSATERPPASLPTTYPMKVAVVNTGP